MSENCYSQLKEQHLCAPSPDTPRRSYQVKGYGDKETSCEPQKLLRQYEEPLTQCHTLPLNSIQFTTEKTI